MNTATQATEQRIERRAERMMPALNPGETYLGVVCEDGALINAHHVILLPGDNDDSNHAAATEWAKARGGELPTRMELLLAFKTQREQFKRDAYWSCEELAGYVSYAWYQYFHYGSQHYWTKDTEFRAVAVRRLPIQ